MIKENERLIIVLGMAHSGTTILTYILSSHPDVELHTGGPESWLLENDWLLQKEAKPIEKILNSTNKRILLKRPWSEVGDADWFLEEMPNAKFVYCYRDFKDMAISWSKPTSFVAKELRNGGIELQKEFYYSYYNKANEFSSKIPNFYWHYHPNFVNMPNVIIQRMTRWLGLRRWAFNTDIVGGKNIKDILKPY